MAADTPALSLSDRLTNQFYDWERHGRGWQVWPEPVDLEPPFKPFLGHSVEESRQDDGRRTTALNSIFASLRSIFVPEPPSAQAPLPEDESDPSPPTEGSGNIEWQILLPAESDTSCRLFEAFLLSLSYCRFPIAFEVLGEPNAIRLILVADEEEASQVEDQLQAHFPEAIACEISVTSTVEQEVGNLKKCLAAGFGEVFMICAEATTVKGLKKAAEAGMALRSWWSWWWSSWWSTSPWSSWWWSSVSSGLRWVVKVI